MPSSTSVALVDPQTGDTVPINACLRRLAAVDGCHILTTEGLGSKKAGFHPLQLAIADGNGSQCGFCTPGWVMNMFSLLGKKEQPTAKEIEDNFDGNLCRCTGYRPVEIKCSNVLFFTENLLENTDGVPRPPHTPPRHSCSLGTAACYLLVMLTAALLMTSSHSEGQSSVHSESSPKAVHVRARHRLRMRK